MLIGNKIYLRILLSADVNSLYLKWMLDPEVNRFLESRWKNHTVESITEFVEKMYKSESNHLFGIFLKDGDKHIGNIKIGDINNHHKFAMVGLLIGEKGQWGKGYAAGSIVLATEYAFKAMKLNKLLAGMYESNVGSYRAFIKAGYTEVARFRKQWLNNGKYEDGIMLEKVNNF